MHESSWPSSPSMQESNAVVAALGLGRGLLHALAHSSRAAPSGWSL